MNRTWSFLFALLLSSDLASAGNAQLRTGECRTYQTFREITQVCPVYAIKTIPVKKCFARQGQRDKCHWVMKKVYERSARKVIREPNPYERHSP